MSDAKPPLNQIAESDRQATRRVRPAIIHGDDAPPPRAESPPHEVRVPLPGGPDLFLLVERGAGETSVSLYCPSQAQPCDECLKELKSLLDRGTPEHVLAIADEVSDRLRGCGCLWRGGAELAPREEEPSAPRVKLVNPTEPPARPQVKAKAPAPRRITVRDGGGAVEEDVRNSETAEGNRDTPSGSTDEDDA